MSIDVHVTGGGNDSRTASCAQTRPRSRSARSAASRSRQPPRSAPVRAPARPASAIVLTRSAWRASASASRGVDRCRGARSRADRQPTPSHHADQRADVRSASSVRPRRRREARSERARVEAPSAIHFSSFVVSIPRRWSPGTISWLRRVGERLVDDLGLRRAVGGEARGVARIDRRLVAPDAEVQERHREKPAADLGAGPPRRGSRGAPSRSGRGRSRRSGARCTPPWRAVRSPGPLQHSR